MIVFTAAAALALVAAGTAAGAAMIAGPIDDSGVIHGCYYPVTSTGSHRVVLQNAGTRCPSGTTAISWSSVAGYQSVVTSPIALSTGNARVASVILPTGRFFMTANVEVQNLASPETASCFLRDGLGHTVASYTGSVTLSNLLENGEITLTGFTTNGGVTSLICSESTTGGTVLVTGAVMTAIPITKLHGG